MTTPSQSKDALPHVVEAIDALAHALHDNGYLTARRAKQVFGAIDKARAALHLPARAEEELL